ncbi:MAG: class I SAM-dependent methyltransferase [bacterium]|nr:class I SAM-dependent methyltransferase [bacterium]
MSYLSAKLFVWLQGAVFYKNLHSEAVNILPRIENGKWLDVGCGPGLMTRLAVENGYDATGIDTDPFMIREARRIAHNERSNAVFEVGDALHLKKESADVVSASSLLATLEDKSAALISLFSAVKHGGVLLVIEPTDKMTQVAVSDTLRTRSKEKGINALRLGARARHGRITDPKIFEVIKSKKISFVPLLGGIVGAWFIYKI